MRHIRFINTMHLTSLCRPQHAPDDLSLLMTSCHQWEVDERPSFTEIVAMELFNVVNKRPSLLSSTTASTQEPEADKQSRHSETIM